MTTAINDNSGASGGAASVYDRPTIILHWLTALLAILQWGGAISMDLVDERPIRMLYWTVHIGLGTALTVVIVARLIWRATRGRVLPPGGEGMLQPLARTVHAVLYALVLFLIALGFGIIALRGWTLIGLFTIKPVISGYYALSRTLVEVHQWTAHMLIAVAAGHALVALYHHYALSDGILRRMTGA